ncbi:T9SS type A sorting domain-containing protein [Crocinitomix algicola]|uniref:T9SS type A sorting domain-containing protein n=1 Tax=Crocinitomix algicola TaxID=1740263 RepID=UPI0009F525D4|nr:T9SS type A sorting domain-containing protein [Crocinitomix algicola]
MKVLVSIMFVLSLLQVKASIVTAVTDGDWDDNSTWDLTAPGCYDTVYVPGNTTVTITSTENYESCGAMIIIVEGTLQFQTGRKLKLPCGDTGVIIYTGGQLKGGGGGGNSNYIEICGDRVWRAGDGDLMGYELLPIELVAFNAEQNERGVSITWVTESELNNDYFVLEHSVDGENWRKIKEVDGAGNSLAQINYQFFHNEPSLNGNYYRLSQVDFDGTTKVFPAIFVNVEQITNQELMVFPNPSTQTLRTIYVEDVPMNGLDVQLYDMSGRLLFNQKVTDFNGNYFVFDFEGIVNPGVYFLVTENQKTQIAFN